MAVTHIMLAAALLAISIVTPIMADDMCVSKRSAQAALTKKVQKEIYDLQHPADCSKAKFLHCDSKGGNINGMGSRVFWLSRCIAKGFDTGRTVVLDTAQSGTAEMWSPFEPWSSCTMADVKKANGRVVRWHSQDNEGKVEEGVKGAIVPKVYASKGYAWWKAQELAYVLRPTAATKAALEKKKQALGWGKGDIVHGMQVRRTDKVHGCAKNSPVKCKAEAPLRPLKDFGEVLHSAAERSARSDKSDAKKVFLASDDPSVRKEARALSGFSFLPFEPAPKRVIGKNIGSRALKDALDMLMLSDTEVLVFTYSSGYGALAFNLKLVREDFCSNFVSIDKGKREYPRVILFGNGGDQGVRVGTKWASNLCYTPPKKDYRPGLEDAMPPPDQACQIITNPKKGSVQGTCRC